MLARHRKFCVVPCSSCLTCTVHAMHYPTMKLADYMASASETDASLAKKIGRDRSFVTKLRLGVASPSLRTARDIAEATKGAVSAEDFFRAEAAQ